MSDAADDTLAVAGLTIGVFVIVSAFAVGVAIVIVLLLLWRLRRRSEQSRTTTVRMVMEDGAWINTHGGGLSGDEREHVDAFMRDEAVTTAIAAMLSTEGARATISVVVTCSIGSEDHLFDWQRNLFLKRGSHGVLSASVHPEAVQADDVVASRPQGPWMDDLPGHLSAGTAHGALSPPYTVSRLAAERVVDDDDVLDHDEYAAMEESRVESRQQQQQQQQQQQLNVHEMVLSDVDDGVLLLAASAPAPAPPPPP